MIGRLTLSGLGIRSKGKGRGVIYHLRDFDEDIQIIITWSPHSHDKEPISEWKQRFLVLKSLWISFQFSFKMFGSSCLCVHAASLCSSPCNRWGYLHFPHSSVQSSKSTCSDNLFFRSSPDKFFSSRMSDIFIFDLCSPWLTGIRIRSGTWSLALQMTILLDVTPTKGSLYFL